MFVSISKKCKQSSSYQFLQLLCALGVLLCYLLVLGLRASRFESWAKAGGPRSGSGSRNSKIPTQYLSAHPLPMWDNGGCKEEERKTTERRKGRWRRKGQEGGEGREGENTGQGDIERTRGVVQRLSSPNSHNLGSTHHKCYCCTVLPPVGTEADNV